jgi:hypothetical protein
MIVPGRSRGNGKRSASRMEPRIMGVVRGTGAGANTGGRPRANARQDLVQCLAMDWLKATGAKPDPGRSDGKGFGDLVHRIFSWIGEPGATHALRTYWRAVSSMRSKPVPGGIEFR